MIIKSNYLCSRMPVKGRQRRIISKDRDTKHAIKLTIYRYFGRVVAASVSTVHTSAVEYHRMIAFIVDADQPTFATNVNEIFKYNFFACLLQRISLVFHKATDSMRCNSPDKHFTVTGT